MTPFMLIAVLACAWSMRSPVLASFTRDIRTRLGTKVIVAMHSWLLEVYIISCIDRMQHNDVMTQLHPGA